jgi:feruloyl esterase
MPIPARMGAIALALVSCRGRWRHRGSRRHPHESTPAVSGVADRLRPLCPYPLVATYAGRGDTNDAASFACRAPARSASGGRP